MFWSGNYIAVRELNFLLKEENVTLTQVLEADDILQECKADNRALMQFLTKPKILAELITLITEEPPKNLELASQYRHASIACEVLTSHLSSLSDRLSMDVAQMNRLCDFINKDPPLNPLLASYFSKTVEMLLERSPKQDWYLYHIVCLRVLDFFKSRRDFLPNLLRHISTSAIADTFKYFIRLDDLFNKIIMEWFEEHQFLECLIQIVCGTYAPEPAKEAAPSPDRPEKGQQELSEKGNHQPEEHVADTGTDGAGEAVSEAVEATECSGLAAATRAERVQAVASANAAALLCDLILSGCAGEGCTTRPRTSWALVSRLQSAEGVRLLLQGMFTAPAAARPHALVHGAHVLLALLDQEPILGGECESERTSVELAVAPHLPLLHQALLVRRPRGVGLPRVQVAALLASLALSEVEEVASTMLTLGTPGVLVDMMFEHENNNFLHAAVAAWLQHALANRAHRVLYARHLLRDVRLLARLVAAFEHELRKPPGSPRSGYMGHVILSLRRVGAALEDPAIAALLDPEEAAHWEQFRETHLVPVLQRHDTPLGGYFPSENIYEFTDVTATASLDDMPNDINADAYNEMCGVNDSTDYLTNELDIEDTEKAEGSKNNFLELANQRFDDDMWEDSPDAEAADEEEEGGAGGAGGALRRARELLDQHSPWESAGCGGGGGEGWAQFEAAPQEHFAAFWNYNAPPDKTGDETMDESMRALRLDDGGMCSVELASKLLSCMTTMMHTDLQDGQELSNVFDDHGNIENSRELQSDTRGFEGFPPPAEVRGELQKDEESNELAGDEVKSDKDVAKTDRDEAKRDRDEAIRGEATPERDETKPSKDKATTGEDEAKQVRDEATPSSAQVNQQAPEQTEHLPSQTPASPSPPSPLDASPPAPSPPSPQAASPPSPLDASPPALQDASPPAESEAQR